MDVERDFTAILVFPFIEPTCRHKTALGSEQLPEHRFLCKAFCSSIDHDRFGSLMHRDHRVRAARGDIEVRPETDGRVYDPESPAEVINTG